MDVPTVALQNEFQLTMQLNQCRGNIVLESDNSLFIN